MHTWWDHGEYEGCDEDTVPIFFEEKYIRSPVKWVIEEETCDGD